MDTNETAIRLVLGRILFKLALERKRGEHDQNSNIEPMFMGATRWVDLPVDVKKAFLKIVCDFREGKLKMRDAHEREVSDDLEEIVTWLKLLKMETL